jgi:hypothetical protein
MSNGSGSSEHENRGRRGMHGNDFSGGIYGMAFLGAAFYFITHAATFWAGVLGVIKAIFWPALLIYKILEHLNM